MRIGYDGKRAVKNLTGLGNYSRLVMEEYARVYPREDLLVYTPDMRENPRLDLLKSLPNVEFRLPPAQGFRGGLWRTFGITNNLRADGVDIYHGLSNELPQNIRSAGVPAVVTVHDVIWRRLPECYKLFDRIFYDYKYGRSCRNADHIIAVSKRTKADVVEFYGIEPDKISVVYQGCDPRFREVWSSDKLDALRRELGLPYRYIVQVGTVEKRKNLELTVRALSNISPDMHLVVVGRDHHGYRKTIDRIAAETGVTPRIKYLENLEFASLPGVYQNAEIAVYPSRYEGFGIPILEALESRVPVIAATGSCLEEAGGEETLYVNPDRPEEMVQAIHALLSDPAATRQMTAAGKLHASLFRSEDLAPQLHEIYKASISAYCRNQSLRQ